MDERLSDVLDIYRQDADLTHGELWFRYFELGGMSTNLQLEAYLYGALRPTAHDHDVIAHALNERFTEIGGDHPVPYLEDEIGA
jgi:predicted DNA-binding ribbon-helix-helix protein